MRWGGKGSERRREGSGYAAGECKRRNSNTRSVEHSMLNNTHKPRLQVLL